jgi:hypothetical protein
MADDTRKRTPRFYVRPRRCNVRFTEEEHAEVAAVAEAHGLALETWLRVVALTAARAAKSGP